MRGQFARPVQLATAFRTNDAMFTAYHARVAPQNAIRLLWKPADTEAGRIACKRGQYAIHAPQHTRGAIVGTMANHGIAIGYLQHSAFDDPEYGPTVCLTLTEWPLEHVRYDVSTNTLQTRTKDHGTVTITHGDGRWIIFRKLGVCPWEQDACVLPGALIWAAHGGAVADWAGASFSHGQAKVVGTPREGVSTGDGTTLTPEAATLLDTITKLAGGESVAGIVPSGSDVKLLFNGSTAWQVFNELVLNRSKAAMRIYQGTDAALGSQGGAPGVDVESLFNVSSTRLQGDLEAVERGLREGAIEPWLHLHGYAREDQFTITYAMPDADGERRASQEAAGIERLGAMVKTLKESGLEVTQDTIDAMVAVLGITVPCTLAAVETQAVPIQLAPTDAAKVVLAREARAAQGLPPFGDERDDMTIPEIEAYVVAKNAPAPAQTPGQASDEDSTDEDSTDESNATSEDSS